jgi:hypothetical protein
MKNVVWAVVAVIAAACYWHGAQKQSRDLNSYPLAVDQGTYLDMAASMKNSHYTVLTSRNRMPMMSLLLSRFYKPGISDDEFFSRAKQANIVLSMGILLGIFFLLRVYLSACSSLMLTLITGFTVFAFKAPFVQCEILFYGLSAALFVLMLRMLDRPSWPLAILTGAMAALTYLTKSSALLGLVIFCGFWLLKHARRPRAFGFIAASIAVFFVAVLPYIRNSHRYYGHYFYNSNSYYVMWHDSWEEAKGPSLIYDTPAVTNIPRSALPSFEKYRREHSARQMWARLWYGMKKLIARSWNAYGYFPYLIGYACLLIFLAIARRLQAAELARRFGVEMLFIATYFAAYYLVFSWYAAIDFGPRFVLAHFVPLMFVFTYGIEKLLSKSRKDQNLAVVLFNTVVGLWLLCDMIFVLYPRLASMFGGT